MPLTEWTKPIISINRASKIYAIFNEFELVRDFRQYDIEQLAIIEASRWISIETSIKPEIKHPIINSYKAS